MSAVCACSGFLCSDSPLGCTHSGRHSSIAVQTVPPIAKAKSRRGDTFTDTRSSIPIAGSKIRRIPKRRSMCVRNLPTRERCSILFPDAKRNPERLDAIAHDWQRRRAADRGKVLLLHPARRMQNQPVLYVREGVNGTDRVLVDVNSWPPTARSLSTGGFPSEDGKYVAYGTSPSGSEKARCT